MLRAKAAKPAVIRSCRYALAANDEQLLHSYLPQAYGGLSLLICL